MKISILSSKIFFRLRQCMKTNTGGSLFLLIFCFPVSELKSQNCNLCSIPSFPSITVYQAFQTGHGIGFGMEAGNWKKDAGKFSYFIGTSLVWSGGNNSNVKISNPAPSQILMNLYIKGQYKLSRHIYAIAAPGVVNLSNFEFQTGLRYVVPVSRIIGLSIEPAYAFYQKQFLVNANLHFALR